MDYRDTLARLWSTRSGEIRYGRGGVCVVHHEIITIGNIMVADITVIRMRLIPVCVRLYCLDRKQNNSWNLLERKEAID